MAASQLTPQSAKLLDFIVAFKVKNGYAPTLVEIAEGMGLNSLATVSKHIARLVKGRYIRNRFNHARSIEVLRRSDAGICPACRRALD